MRLAYSTGARLNEIRHIKIKDIDNKRNVINIKMGKGSRDRNLPLSPLLLEDLRLYFQTRRNHIKSYLFVKKDPNTPVDPTTIQKAFKKIRIKAGISKHATMHTLRHSFATHLLEQNVNILIIKRLLGHTALKTTFMYLHLAKDYIDNFINPLDTLFDKGDSENKDNHETSKKNGGK